MSKKQWGNITWWFFHTLAYRLKPEGNWIVPILFGYMKEISRYLPCPDCAEHATRMWNSCKIPVRTRDDLIIVLFQGHNVVNKRLNKPEFTIEQHDLLYKNANINKIIHNFIKIMNSDLSVDKRLMMNFHRKRTIKEFINFLFKQKHYFS